MEQFEFNTLGDLVEFIFIKNVNNYPISLETPELRDTMNMYEFCVELTIQGLNRMYGKEEDDYKVDIPCLTMSQIEMAQKRLKSAGIIVSFDVKEMETDDALYIDNNKTRILKMKPRIMMQNKETGVIEEAPIPTTEEGKAEMRKCMNTYPLEKYLLLVIKGRMAYHIRYKLSAMV